ncbi:hypothetical protein [Methylobacterium aquaticum]|uniref:hypothetical protein n=1 Tax=Methylobacterium aquaticum TaxID=270351 RepID=UPI0019335CDD|nr:hypothetical protein [Methylobacterium aquaticum]QRE77357.1 hypothetical protein F1D61_30955 [Methylobacterium aquaticum]
MGEILRHKKTGGLYEVLLGRGVVHSDVPLSDDAPVTVCRRIPDGQIVARFGPTPRGSFDVLHHSRLQTDALIHDGAEVVVYRAVGGGPVWVRRASEMDDGRFEPAEAPQLPSSTPEEVERLVDALIAVAQDGAWTNHDGAASWGRDEYDTVYAKIVAARTALLSHISTAGRGEGAGASAVMRKALEFYADPKNWIDTPSWDGDPGCITPLAIPIRDEGHGGTPCDCGDTARIALSAADATNPQDQE